MDKKTSVGEAISRIKDGDILLVGGFLQGGSPETLLNELLKRNISNLTIVSNDTGTTQTATIKLMEQGRVSHVKATYIGANPLTEQMLISNPADVELVPQGTMAERIRAGGAGLGGILTPVGVGTIVEKGKRVYKLNNKKFILEEPIKGDVALVHATVADKSGNCFMRGSTKNFNALMPAAAKFVVVEAEKIVEVGELNPEMITVPGILVDAVVKVDE